MLLGEGPQSPAGPHRRFGEAVEVAVGERRRRRCRSTGRGPGWSSASRSAGPRPSRPRTNQPRSSQNRSLNRCRSAAGAVGELVGGRRERRSPRRSSAAPSERRVGVALHLDERDRPVRQRAVGEVDAVPRVLPALVGQSGRVAALVVDETVAVRVAVADEPGDRGVDAGAQDFAGSPWTARPSAALRPRA